MSSISFSLPTPSVSPSKMVEAVEAACKNNGISVRTSPNTKPFELNVAMPDVSEQVAPERATPERAHARQSLSARSDGFPSPPQLPAPFMRRRSAMPSTTSSSWTRDEICVFLLSSRELAAAADFVAQLVRIGGLADDVLLREFKTILIDVMAAQFAVFWDLRNPTWCIGQRTILHAPHDAHVDALLARAFARCALDPALLAALLPVSFALTVSPGLVVYTTSDVPDFQPVHLYEARPYLPPRNPDPIDHGAEARQRALRAIELGHASLENFNLAGYFGKPK